jgi:hypothetical protein
MIKIAMFFSVLSAFMLMSSLPAFSGGTGPYGGYGPYTSYDMEQGVESHHTAYSGGSGPYGAYGPFGMKEGVDSHQFANKDECLLVAMNCPPDSGFIQNRIDRLNAEIAKGTDVYTPGELRVLNHKLNDAYRELNNSNSGY